MATAVFFSGGIDSTTLAFDIAMNPHRYGVQGTLYLLTYGKKGSKDNFFSLVNDIRMSAPNTDIVHLVRDPHLKEYPQETVMDVAEVLDPLAVGETQFCSTLPHTPGLHLWMASWAINVLSNSQERISEPLKAFFGFHFGTPAWVKIDKEDFAKTDAGPEFIAGMNSLSRSCGMDVHFHAPFLYSRSRKVDIVRLGKELGVPYSKTSSCIQGFKVDCGKCAQCIIHNSTVKAVYG